MILLHKLTKSEIDQEQASFLSTSLLLPTSIVTLLSVLLSLSTVKISTTRTTTQDVTMHLPFFIFNNRDVKESSDLKLNQPTTQSTLSSIQFGDLKIEDIYRTFRPSFTTVLCKNLHWNLQLAGSNRWKHKWKHKRTHTQHEHKISSTELLQYQELIKVTTIYAIVTLDIYHDTFNFQLDGSSDSEIVNSIKTLTYLQSIIITSIMNLSSLLHNIGFDPGYIGARAI